MIVIEEISPKNESEAARRLRAAIARAWPGVEASPGDRVTIVVGIEALREIDLLVFVELSEPREVPPVLRRDGARSERATVRSAVLVVEVKQLDATRFTVVGPEIFPDYHGAGYARSVNAQVADATIALRTYAGRYGLAPFFVYGLGWLTAVPEAELRGVNPWIVGEEASWFDMLDAAAQRSTSLYGSTPAEERTAVATIRETLTRKRAVSPRDRRRVNELCNDVLANDVLDELEAVAGRKLVKIAGRGGSGKTTTLGLLAKRLAEGRGERVLILTFHKALRGDIEHLVRTLVDVPGIVGSRIAVETMLAFVGSAVVELGGAVPQLSDGAPDFARFDKSLAETLAQLVERDFADLERREPERFAWDYVFVDESQDCSDAERDLLRAMYGDERLVLADGLDQLVRRQTPCDWIAGVPKENRHHRALGRSLRMTKNVADFANAVARESGLANWHIAPYDRLPGGRIVVVVGGDPSSFALVASLRALTLAGGAAPVDALVCVPPSPSGAPAAISIVDAMRGAGETVWNGCEPAVRDTVPAGTDAWRVVRYDSCRGLEGWVTLALGLDALVASKRKYPNFASGESDAPENVARRWLMIALTRAVHALVIGIDDPNAPLLATLRAAAARLPAGVVEWADPATLPALLAPVVAGSTIAPRT